MPQDDTYGMLVRSRLPIVNAEVRHFVEETVPSIELTLELASGEPVRLVLLHPRPPRPDIGQDSRLRDAELVMAGREVATFTEPTIVAGDLNDVAWSHSTTLFQELSGLLDPRIGRGLFSTFHAQHWWLRYPLDHVFHSDDLTLVKIERLGNVGSDHFPMLIELAVDPSKRALQDGPELDRCRSGGGGGDGRRTPRSNSRGVARGAPRARGRGPVAAPGQTRRPLAVAPEDERRRTDAGGRR